MADLRSACEDLGLADVATYIQSGNVLFFSPRQRVSALAAQLERELSTALGVELKVVVLTRPQLARVVDEAPAGFGDDAYRCDVIFVRSPLTVAGALSVVELRDGVDQVWKGPGVLYFSRLDARAASSKLSKVVAKPEYQNMTIRNWNSTTKLLSLMIERAERSSP